MPWRWVAALGATTLVLALGVALINRPVDGPGPQAAQARAWMTSAHQPDRLRESPVRLVTAQPTAASGTPEQSPTLGDVVIDPTTTDQEVTGFGAALTHSSAVLIERMSKPAREDLLRELFAPDGPTRLSVVRIPLGGSDFVVEPPYTYDDLPPGETDWDLTQFTTARDEPALRTVLRDIRAIAPDVVFIASPWSPPAWLKDSGTLEGGRLLDDDRAYRTYATYLVRTLMEYDAAGLPIDLLTVQNEPQARNPDGYPGTDMPVADQVRLLEQLGPMIEEADLPTRLLAFDHNWELHPADAASTPAGRDQEEDYPLQVLRSDAARWVAGTAFHCYYGDASAQATVRRIAPDKSIWVTECSGSHGPDDTPAEVFAATLQWQARNLLVASLEHGATGVLTWNLALDQQGGPHIGGCDTCTGIVSLNGDDVTRNAEYYVLAHAARFLPRGSVRVVADTAPDASFGRVAFRTPDGAIVVLLSSAADETRTVGLVIGDERLVLSVEASSLTTVVVTGIRLDDRQRAAERASTRQGAPVSGQPLQEVDLGTAVATASPHAPRDPCCTADVPARVLDGNDFTRWSSGRAQRSGDHLEIDLGRVLSIRTIVLDAGPTGDWPRGWELMVSQDGERWSPPVATGRGAGTVTAIDVGGTAARHVRVQLTDRADPWWSVTEVRVFT